MAAITPTVAAGSMLGLDLLQSAQQVRVAQQRATASSAAARANADLQLAALESRQAEDTAKRQLALRRAQARTRALMASRGIGGSGGAVLQGLAVEAAREEAFALNDADLKRQQIEQGVDTTHQRNLLAASEAKRRAQIDVLRTGARTLASQGN